METILLPVALGVEERQMAGSAQLAVHQFSRFRVRYYSSVRRDHARAGQAARARGLTRSAA
jgi:hypothetical protein